MRHAHTSEYACDALGTLNLKLLGLPGRPTVALEVILRSVGVSSEKIQSPRGVRSLKWKAKA